MLLPDFVVFVPAILCFFCYNHSFVLLEPMTLFARICKWGLFFLEPASIFVATVYDFCYYSLDFCYRPSLIYDETSSKFLLLASFFFATTVLDFCYHPIFLILYWIHLLAAAFLPRARCVRGATKFAKLEPSPKFAGTDGQSCWN